MSDIGNKIKNARKAKGLTQAQLAKRLGIAYQNIGQWESGKRSPKLETIKAISKALGLKDYELLDPIAYEYGVSQGINLETWGNKMVEDCLAAEGYTYSELEFSLINAFSCLNRKGQQVAVNRLQELTEIPRYRADVAAGAEDPADDPADKD